jgi:glycosyltransferase involved in cell wall biosynthesis
VQIASETAMSQGEIEQLTQCPLPNGESVRFIEIARLLHWKGFHLGLRAFAKAKLPDAEYWIVGEGPELERLHNLTLDLGIAHQVKFWGLLPRDEVLQKLAQSSVLVHPSLHDSGGWVCLEAMAAGRPVICLDLGGPAVQVTSETGFKVPAHNPEQAVSDLAQAMVRLARDKNLRLQMGRAGQQRIWEYYSWEAKGKQLAQVYEQVVARSKH